MAYETYEQAIEGLNALVTQMRKDNLGKEAIADDLVAWIENEDNFPNTEASNEVLKQLRESLSEVLHEQLRRDYDNFRSVLGAVEQSEKFENDNLMYLYDKVDDKSYFVDLIVSAIEDQFVLEDTESPDESDNLTSEQDDEAYDDSVQLSVNELREKAVRLNAELSKRLKAAREEAEKIGVIIEKLKAKEITTQELNFDELIERLQKITDTIALIKKVQKEADPLMEKRQYQNALEVYEKAMESLDERQTPTPDEEDENVEVVLATDEEVEANHIIDDLEDDLNTAKKEKEEISALLTQAQRDPNIDVDRLEKRVQEILSRIDRIEKAQVKVNIAMEKEDFDEAISIYKVYLNPIAFALLDNLPMPHDKPDDEAVVRQVESENTQVEVDISFRNASPLQKANKLLEQALMIQKQENYLNTEGIYRLSSEAGLVTKEFDKVIKDPSQDLREVCGDFIANPINLAALVKQSLQNLPVWEQQPQKILRDFINARNDPMNFDICIKDLIKSGYSEEAKLLHNMLYLGQMVASRSDENLMKAYNMAVIFAPTLDSLANIVPKDMRDALLVGLTGPLQVKVSEDPLGLKKFTQPFEEVYPEAAKALSSEYAKLPQHEAPVKPVDKDVPRISTPQQGSSVSTPNAEPPKSILASTYDWMGENIGKPIKAAFGFVTSGFGLFSSKQPSEPVISAPIRKGSVKQPLATPSAPINPVAPVQAPVEHRVAAVVTLKRASESAVQQPQKLQKLNEDQENIKMQIEGCIKALIDVMKVHFYKFDQENQFKTTTDAIKMFRKLKQNEIDPNKLPTYAIKDNGSQFPAVVAMIVEELQRHLDLMEVKGRTVTSSDIEGILNKLNDKIYNAKEENPLKILKDELVKLEKAKIEVSSSGPTSSRV